MTTNAAPSIDWTTYGAAVATGLRRYRDGRLPMNPAIQAVRDGGAVRFEFGADTTIIPDRRVVWEARNFDAASYEPNEPLDALTEDDLAQIEAWYSDPRNFDGHRIEEEIVEAIEAEEAL